MICFDKRPTTYLGEGLLRRRNFFLFGAEVLPFFRGWDDAVEDELPKYGLEVLPVHSKASVTS